MEDHRRLLRSAETQAVLTPPDGFEELTVRTNASLLRPFRLSSGRVTALQQKLEFYRVVEAGGRLLCLTGVMLVALAALRVPRPHKELPSGAREAGR
ncbi:MAG: hypothetical protein KatS3mg077_0944 [Candidatus Binatia bacterium]|nr:MAG: hypothetical protein KatS3mg077_0944 [Candidatus Binatia bacterium]